MQKKRDLKESLLMRTLAVGDIHGCLRSLLTMAEFVPFKPDDLLITLGDYVDRGPDSRGVVGWLIERTLDYQCVPLRGNHEVMLLEALSGRMRMDHWAACGGDTTLSSYRRRGRSSGPLDIPDEHHWFLSRVLKPYYETDTHIFVHAHALPDLPMDKQTDDVLYWERFDWLLPHGSGKTVICGHTAQRSGLPWNKGFGVCIDTCVYGEGWLTCLDVETGHYWQANEQGETREGDLGEPDSTPSLLQGDFEG